MYLEEVYKQGSNAFLSQFHSDNFPGIFSLLSTMSPIRISFVLLIALACCSLVLGQRGGGRGRGNYGAGMRLGGGGRGGYINAGFGGGRGGRRYRSTLYNDDDVYGYEANYPGGEALYVNYRNSEARAKRGEEFARNNPYSSSSNFKASGGQQEYPQQGERDERDTNIGGMW